MRLAADKNIKKKRATAHTLGESNEMQESWWKEAVVYQIYPRSFCDSNNDGIGDLRGIISKLDYLKDLGVNAIWLSPVYKSPNDDNGYDVSDYQDIMTEFGNMADFDEMLEQMHARGIKLIMDLIVNHTSDEHVWFEESRQSRDNPYRDWYIWRPGKNGREPNNWECIFRGSAWQYDEATDEYYLHLFSKKQPDLNWENPEVREAVYDMMVWWLDKGVDGFRLDAINFLSKEPTLPDVPPGENSPYGIATQYYAYGPRFYEFMQEMKEKVLSHYDILTVGEAAFSDARRAIDMTHEDSGFLSMIFQFEHMHLDVEVGERIAWEPRPMRIAELKSVLSRWQYDMAESGWNSQYFGNHDHPRAVSRFGNDGEYRLESAKLLATVMHTLKGTPFIYQGEEIGMTNVAFSSIDDFRDIATINAYAEYVEVEGMSPDEVLPLACLYSRDNARTPMQWDKSRHAGFSDTTPWIGVNSNYVDVNVEQALADDNSILNFYREIIRLRRENPVFIHGTFELIEDTADEMFAYWRRLDATQLLVLNNFSDSPQVFTSPDDLQLDADMLLLGNYPCEAASHGRSLMLRPYESRLYLGDF